MTERLIDGPPDAYWTFLLAHGAGQGMGSDFMTFFAHHLARDRLRVVRFEFPYMAATSRDGQQRPPDRTPALIERWDQELAWAAQAGIPLPRLVIGGKSLGGRIASLIAERAGVAALVCLGYPFHAVGKPEQRRIEHLETLGVPTLICQGTRDPFGNRAEVPAYPLSAQIEIAWIPDGDHSFCPSASGGRSHEQNLLEAVDRIERFLASLRTKHAGTGVG